MTEIILSQWVIASTLGALCLGFLILCVVPAVIVGGRIRSLKRGLRTDSEQLKDSLVKDMRGVLEQIAEMQSKAASEHQAKLGQHLAAALQQPLEGVARGLKDFSKNQNAEISQGLQDYMSVFADKLDQLLGGQIEQAKELQLQTVKSLDNTIAAVNQMAQTIAATAENSSQSMVNQLRAGISRSQAETDANLKDLLGKLSSHVKGVVTTIEQQASLSGRTAIEQQKNISDQAHRSIEALSSEVRSQSQAIEVAAQSMRSVGNDVANAVDRIIEGMTGLISGAAQEFMRSGQGFANIFEKSSALSHDLADTAAALAASSRDIGVVATDYRSARETLEGMVDLMRSTVEAARNDSSLASDFVARIEAAAQKLMTAQGQADNSLVKLNSVLSEAHNAFGPQMLDTVRDFHDHLSSATPSEQMSDESRRRYSEFDRMISDWVQATPRLKGTSPGPRSRAEEAAARRAAPGNGRE